MKALKKIYPENNDIKKFKTTSWNVSSTKYMYDILSEINDLNIKIYSKKEVFIENPISTDFKIPDINNYLLEYNSSNEWYTIDNIKLENYENTHLKITSTDIRGNLDLYIFNKTIRIIEPKYYYLKIKNFNTSEVNNLYYSKKNDKYFKVRYNQEKSFTNKQIFFPQPPEFKENRTWKFDIEIVRELEDHDIKFQGDGVIPKLTSNYIELRYDSNPIKIMTEKLTNSSEYVNELGICISDSCYKDDKNGHWKNSNLGYCDECEDNWWGTNCDKCNGRGTSYDSVTKTCTCLAGSSGNNCQFLDADTCNGNGVAQSDGSCSCDDGYTGNFCCSVGYAGNSCQYSHEVTCNGNGTVDDNGNCSCNTETQTNKGIFTSILKWSGKNCSYKNFISGITPCGNGTDVGNGDCTCNEGWGGNNCTICAEGYTGNNCQYSNSGKCNGNGTVSYFGYCSCNPGWAGNKCQYSDAVTCNGNGIVDDNGNCLCKIGFFGNDCDRCNSNGKEKILFQGKMKDYKLMSNLK